MVAGRKGNTNREREKRTALRCLPLPVTLYNPRNPIAVKVTRVSRFLGSARDEIPGIVSIAYSAHKCQGFNSSHMLMKMR